MSEEKRQQQKMNDNTWCTQCKQNVRPKLNISWAIVIISVLLFLPATAAYIGYKLYKPAYLCPICEQPLEA